MVGVADHAASARSTIEAVVAPAWLNALRGAHAAGRGAERIRYLCVVGVRDVPVRQRIAQAGGVHGGDVAVMQAGAVEFAQDGDDAARAMDVFQMDVGYRGRDLAQTGHPARQPVDVAPW